MASSLSIPVALCAECDDPVVVGVTGWYRCRSCGYESLRSFSADPVVSSSFSSAAADIGARAPSAAEGRLGLSLFTTSDKGEF